MTKLRIWATIQAAYGFFFSHQSDFWRLAALPIAIYYALFFVVLLFAGVELVQSGWGDVLGLVLGVLAAPFIVAWHRLVLLGPEAIAGQRGLTFGRREGLFIVLTLLPVGLIFAVIIVIANLGAAIDAHAASPAEPAGFDVGFILPMVIILFVMAPLMRVLLIFPSIATDQGVSIRQAWKLAKGNTFRFAAIIFLVGFSLRVVFWIIDFSANFLLTGNVSSESGMVPTIAITRAIQVLENFIGGSVGVSALSLSYRFLTPAGGADARAEA